MQDKKNITNDSLTISRLRFVLLSGQSSDLLLSIVDSKLPCVLYFGKRLKLDAIATATQNPSTMLPKTATLESDAGIIHLPNPNVLALVHFYFASLPSLGKAMLDKTRELSLTPEHGWAFPGEAGMHGFFKNKKFIRHGFTQFQTTQPAIFSNTSSTSSMEIDCHDISGLELKYRFEFCKKSDVLKASSTITNSTAKLSYDREINAKTTVDDDSFANKRLEEQEKRSIDDHGVWHLQWLSAPVFPLSQAGTHFFSFFGRWTKEMQPQRSQWATGIFEKKTVVGRTSHDHFPAMMFRSRGENFAGEMAGETLIAHLGYSGNHRMLVEQMVDGSRQLQCGENLMPGEVVLNHGESYTTPPLFLSRSRAGRNGAMKKLHRWLRRCSSEHESNTRPRRVFYNVWEAIYFNHSLEKLFRLARKASALGAERFVLDDGWFHKRTDQTRALGDWHVDKEKYPNGLKPLVDYVKSLGLDFGIWMEPEMVSKDSDLYRKHPNWVIEDPQYAQVIGRQQWVLNLTIKQAYQHILEAISKLLSQNDIAYIKWDMNRSLSLAVDSNGKSLYRRQTFALYSLLEEIKRRFPKIEIESCSSGGGRIDYGILQRTNRVWLSDSNDAHERARMQHHALLFIPPETIGSHVGPRKCHTSGRILSMAFRAWVAASCHMGYELDLEELDEKEEKTLKRITTFYKKERDFIRNANVYLLEPSSLAEQANRVSHMYIDSEKRKFIVFLFQLDSEKWALSTALRLKGLKADYLYRVTLINREDMPQTINYTLEMPLCQGDLQLTGEHLTRTGLNLPLLYPQTAVVLVGNAV